MKLKKIAAAVALVAAAVPAMANIDFPNTGNGELVVVVLDRTDGASYLLDLGLGLDAFNGNGSYNYTLDGANFNAFLTAAATTANPLEFAVFGGDSVGSTAANPRRLFSTVNGPDSLLGNTQLTNATNNTTTFLNYQLTDAANQTHTAVANGDSWAAAGNNAYFMQFAGDSFNNQAPGWLNTNTVGTNAAFRGFATSSTSGGAQTIKTDFAGQWSLQNNAGVYTLSYAGGTPPIPEADGIVLLMAGLGAIAFVGRRRRDH